MGSLRLCDGWAACGRVWEDVERELSCRCNELGTDRTAASGMEIELGGETRTLAGTAAMRSAVSDLTPVCKRAILKRY